MNHHFLRWLYATHKLSPCQHVGLVALWAQYGAEYRQAQKMGILDGLKKEWALPAELRY